MTKDNRRLNIFLEAGKARHDAQSARTLMEAEAWDNAVAMAYYSAFHWGQALVLSEGLEARTHGGLVHLINLHFVRTGRLAPEVARHLGELQSSRHDASYDVTAVFTRSLAEDAVQKASEYGSAIQGLLKADGYLQD